MCKAGPCRVAKDKRETNSSRLRVFSKAGGVAGPTTLKILRFKMTAQCADQLYNEHPRVDLDGLQCFGLGREVPENGCGGMWGGLWVGHNSDLSVFPKAPDPGRCKARIRVLYCSNCDRRYVASYILRPDGKLTVMGYDYATLDGGGACRRGTPINYSIEDPVNEDVEGDFVLIMKLHFSSPSTTFVPFRDGRVVEDVSKWTVT